jgi:hypothetical protein
MQGTQLVLPVVLPPLSYHGVLHFKLISDVIVCGLSFHGLVVVL